MKRNKKRYQDYITGNCDHAEMERIAAELQRLSMDADDAVEGDEVLSDYDGDIDAELSGRLLSRIEYETIDKQKRRRRRALKLTSAITGLIVVLGSIHLYKKESTIQKASVFLDNKTTIYNHGDTISIRRLPDKSMVQLFPNSSISFKEGFLGKARNIHLHGTAIFKVSKDPARPFNVFSGQLVTTAIGTEFKVSEYSQHILIKLLEGKIVVKKSTASNEAYYLLAGNAINYNRANGSFTPILNTAKAYSTPYRHSKGASFIKKKMEPDHIRLNNVPMADALDKIAQRYNVEIQYSPSDVADINIIANLNPKQSVRKILDNIALMNHLKIWVLDDREFIIEKQKEGN